MGDGSGVAVGSSVAVGSGKGVWVGTAVGAVVGSCSTAATSSVAVAGMGVASGSADAQAANPTSRNKVKMSIKRLVFKIIDPQNQRRIVGK